MKAKKTTPKRTLSSPSSAHQKLPFIEHLYELRKRLFYIVLSVGLWATGAYFIQQHLVTILLAPAKRQEFIYTSVGGGIDFLFRICLYTGIVFSIPVIVYHALSYMKPLIKQDAVRFITWGSVISGFLALGGILFGYLLGLPAALHFLLHQFTSSQIHPLLTIQSYMSFVLIYLVGSALLFQLPLVLVIINRIKPLQPKKLFKYERWVILLAFVGGGIMNPSPRVQDQLLLSVPVILTYQLGIGLVWLINRKKRHAPGVISLLEQDAKNRAERLARFRAAQKQAPVAAPMVPAQRQAPVPKPVIAMAPAVQPAPAPSPTPQAQPVISSNRPARYLNDFTGRRTSYNREPSSA